MGLCLDKIKVIYPAYDPALLEAMAFGLPAWLPPGWATFRKWWSTKKQASWFLLGILLFLVKPLLSWLRMKTYADSTVEKESKD